MTVLEIRHEELEERIENKTAYLCGEYLKGQMFQGTNTVVERLQNEINKRK